MKQRTLRIGMQALAAAAAICATALGSAPASAAEPREDLRAAFDLALKGKKVAWAPVWLGVLESEWTRNMKPTSTTTACN